MAMEWTIFISMAVLFVAGVFAGRLSVGVSLAIAAVGGGLMSGLAQDPLELVRLLSEGALAYFDPILYIASAMIFIAAIERSGLLGTVVRGMILTFHRNPVMLLTSATLLVLFPGMMTGSSTAAVLSTGALVAPVLMKVGVPRERAGAIIAMIAVYGQCAPPVNIPALIIGAGADIPYLGFGLPLLLLSLPPALLATLWLGLRHVKRCDRAELEANLPESLHATHGWPLYLPLVILTGLLLGERFAPGPIRQLGLPLIFLISTLAALLTGRRTPLTGIVNTAMRRSISILAILVGVGMFIQIMTYSGARGAVAVACTGMPRELLYPIAGISLPLFGAVSSFGAASVLGVPFILSMLNQDIIITCSALSMIACLGDLMPPTALAGLFAAEVVAEKNYFRILRLCIIPAICTVLLGITVIIFSNSLAGLALYDSNMYTTQSAPTESLSTAAPAAVPSLSEAASGGLSAGTVHHAVTAIYWVYVGALALIALLFLWREPTVMMRLNAVLFALPLTLRAVQVM
jgi:TRAP-type C4-dicarboxylate transport system permease large subunit